MTEQSANDRQAQPPTGADARERMPQIIQARVLAEPSAVAHPVPDGPQLLDRLASALAWKYPCRACLALLAQSLDHLDRSRIEREFVLLPLLHMRAGLDPIAGLFVELGPLGELRLLGTSARQHDQPHAVRRGLR